MRASKTIFAVLLFFVVASGVTILEFSENNKGRTFGDFAAIWQSVYNVQSRGAPASSYNCSVHYVIGITDFKDAITLPAGLSDCNQLGIHFHGLVFPVGWLAKFFPYQSLLLILQAIAIATASILLFSLSLDLGLPVAVAFLAGLAFAINPYIQGLFINDFHFDAFAPAVAIAAVLFWRKKNWISLAILFAVAPFIKESFSMMLAGFALYFAIDAFLERSRARAIAAAMTLCWAIISLNLLLHVLIPQLSFFNRFMFGTVYGNNLGGSPVEIVSNFFLRPTESLKILSSKENLILVRDLILSGGVLCLLYPPALFIGSGFLFINLVSTNNAMKIMWGQYNVAVIAAFWIATVFALSRFKRKRYFAVITSLALLGFIHLSLKKGPLGADQRLTITWSNPDIAVLKLVLPERSVCTVDKGSYELSSRYELFMVPAGLSRCEYLVLESKLPPNSVRPEFLNQFQEYTRTHFSLIGSSNRFEVYHRTAY